MRLRAREKVFGRRREEATIRGGGCDKPTFLIWFRPKSEKVRVWVWGKSGKREVDAQSPWLQLAATVFRSTNSDSGSGKVPLSLWFFLLLIFSTKNKIFLIFCIVLGFRFLLIKKLNSLLRLGKNNVEFVFFDTNCVQVKRQQKKKQNLYVY